MNTNTEKLINSLGFSDNSRRPSSFTFSKNPASKDWKALTFDSPLPIYHITTSDSNISKIRTFLNGIQTENFLLVATLTNFDLLVIRRFKKGDHNPKLFALRKKEDYDRVINVLQKLNFASDELTSHASLNMALDLIQSGAQQHFINRGLFSNYFLKERLFKEFPKRKRNPESESKLFLKNIPNHVALNYDNIEKIFNELGYQISQQSENKWILRIKETDDIIVIVSKAENLDVKFNDSVPSYQAVAQLEKVPWVILTNGRLWRLYGSKVSSASTNYFEIDLEGITDEKDPKILYFISIFSAASRVIKDGGSDLDFIFDGGVRYASEIESELKNKIFNEQLFLNLVRGVIDHSHEKAYSKEELESAKAIALKLLYRLLFILYAESRELLPVGHSGYEKISLNSLRQRITAFEKDENGVDCWGNLKNLFKGISEGNSSANLPQYDGMLFEHNPNLDDLVIRNKFLVPTIRDLTEIDGKGIDYQNLGVRHLGSLYEALLEYSIEQANYDLMIYKNEILDATFVSDLKQKPEKFIKKGEVLLSVGGLARKETGSYFTPDEIVKFLVKKGLELILQKREIQYKKHYELWIKKNDEKLKQILLDDLLDLQVLDPAMGSGHFLVAAVDEITRWIIVILQQYPKSSLIEQINKDREDIILQQKKKGIILNEELLTFNVLLKRIVMKRCIFGVDINPLSVELAKLSLWLDSFTIGTPLTFLDHHIRNGDSLTGLWLKNLEQKSPSEETLDKWMSEVISQGDLLHEISIPTDININQINQSKKYYDKYKKEIEPLKKILDLLCAGIIDKKIEQKRPKNLPLVVETIRSGILSKAVWKEEIEKSAALAETHKFFHYELEFPDGFTDKRRGFDLIITNPPWDAIQPSDDDFFSQYHKGFRRIKSKSDKNKIKEKILKDKKIADAFSKFTRSVEDKLSFYKNSGEYIMHGSENPDTWKCFVEKIFKLLTEQGTFSVLLPSGIITNKGAKDMREVLLNKKIRILYEFENKYKIFPIHSSYKFVLLIVENIDSNDDFPAAFYLHHVDSLKPEPKQEKSKFLNYKKDLVRLTSPNNLIFPEFKNQKDVNILEICFSNHKLLKDPTKTWSVILVEELSRTRSTNLFQKSNKGWPVLEGKSFHQFLPEFEKHIFSILPKDGLDFSKKVRAYKGINEKIHEVSRLLFRTVASSTNVRTMIACIVPKHSFFTDSASLVLPMINESVPFGKKYYEIICYVCGIFNSMVYDFIIKRRVNINLSNYFIDESPIPEEIEGFLPKNIIQVTARLSTSGTECGDLAEALKITAKNLSIKERVDLTAELEALVAHHYGMTRKDFEYIINSFNFDGKDGFIEQKEVVWGDANIKYFYHEVRKLSLIKFDHIKELMGSTK